ncbi:MAG: hypothetical protein O6922_04155, partial [Chloroflexi bacterium]|nr:hypothetical protein [Chloroflexota bacterium]
MNRVTLPASRARLAALLLGAFAIIAITSCTGPTEQDTRPGPTSTSIPATATVTPEPSGPEMTRVPGTVDEQPAAQATVSPATAVTRESTPTVVPTVEPTRTPTPTPTPVPTLAPGPTPTPPPPRAIATGPVDRIAFADGLGSIFTVNPDGSGLATVADSSMAEGELLYTFPVWSPDGGSLAFSSILIVSGAATRSAYHRADADGSGGVITLAFDYSTGSGVGPGIPHFSSWSPDGTRIALTTSGEFGIGTMVLGSYSGQSPRAIALGAPLYVNWAPDGTALLVHQVVGLHMIAVTDLGAGLPTLIGTGSMSYFSPSWAPDSGSFAHVEFVDGNNSVVLTQKGDTNDQVVITGGDIRVGLGWSPDGKRLAISKSSGDAFETLSIFSADDGLLQTLLEGEIRAFWWSPDSSRLAIVEDSPVIEFAHVWSVIDVESGDVTPLVTQFVSDDFFFVQTFFDQYVESHSIWAPDSSRIVIAGAILDPSEVVRPGGEPRPPQEFDSQIWVIDAAGIDDPVSVGTGTIA